MPMLYSNTPDRFVPRQRPAARRRVTCAPDGTVCRLSFLGKKLTGIESRVQYDARNSAAVKRFGAAEFRASYCTVQRTKLCRREVRHGSVAMVLNTNTAEKKEGSESV
ncbi:hypothetical protein EVAR_3798_1 [Eumeta japonica]|uniref:Uncharacterized protein n=1 Tax=Eumeta variegata TaxID=151549 RepID=A0A4C1SRR0_EUMVA|nr:hypothetical protein EVAR_3798_1 [Eumeta japonica]